MVMVNIVRKEVNSYLYTDLAIISEAVYGLSVKLSI